MSMEERRLYNQKRRLRQLGLPENIDEIPKEKLEKIKKHISDVNSRKAEAARQRYHRMVINWISGKYLKWQNDYNGLKRFNSLS